VWPSQSDKTRSLLPTSRVRRNLNAGTQRSLCAKPVRQRACQFRRLSGWCSGGGVQRRRSGVRRSRIGRREPRDGRGSGQDRRHAARQNRHMSDVTDRAGSFRARRVGMPERCADGYRKDSHQRSHECRTVKPSNSVVIVTHYRRRTKTRKMLTQTPAAGKRSHRAVLWRIAPQLRNGLDRAQSNAVGARPRRQRHRQADEDRAQRLAKAMLHAARIRNGPRIAQRSSYPPWFDGRRSH
jgi:hypothetical protein